MATPEALQEWRNKNRERVREISRDCYNRNKEHHLSRQKKWRENNQLYLKNWREQNRDRLRAAGRKFEYNLTPEQYETKLREQEGKCALCLRVFENYDVDHDHSCCSQRKTCGQCNRGLLCHGCNTALGLFGESVETLQRAIDYLKKYERLPNE